MAAFSSYGLRQHWQYTIPNGKLCIHFFLLHFSNLYCFLRIYGPNGCCRLLPRFLSFFAWPLNIQPKWLYFCFSCGTYGIPLHANWLPTRSTSSYLWAYRLWALWFSLRPRHSGVGKYLVALSPLLQSGLSRPWALGGDRLWFKRKNIPSFLPDLHDRNSTKFSVP